MRRVVRIIPAGGFAAARVTDRVVLDAHERHRRRIVLTAESGARVLLDQEHAVRLRDGDGLELDDGTVFVVVGRPEALIEISATSETERLRLAWHIGNRHADVQVIGDRLRIRRDHVLEEMLRGLGATLVPVEAAFEPEGGAYAHAHGEHGHHHGHAHDH